MSFYIPPNDSFNGLRFVHIPKTGGTSIMLAMKSPFEEVLVDVGHASINELDHINCFSFSVFRNPYSRAVSFYNEMYSLITNRPELTAAITELTNGRDPIEEYNLGFSYFVENYFTKSLLQPDTGNFTIPASYHQLSFITKDKKIAVDCLLDFENLSTDWQKIEDYIGFEVLLPMENVGQVNVDTVSISDTARDIIEFYYKEDIEFYRNWKK